MTTQVSLEKELVEMQAPYEGQKGALIPLLQKVQERYGYLSRETVEAIAEFLHITPNEVYGVATFYAQFRLSPQGRHVVKVCQGTACHVRGGRRILDAVQGELGIEAGETTPDYTFTVERVACFGSCALAPVMVIDKDVYGRMTPSRVKQLLAGQ